jgi:HD-like signal output (HDOD) protein
MEIDLAQLDQEAESFVQDLGIPPCPAIITRIVREARAEDPDFNRVAALISTDVTLSAAMLSTVNSAYYGLRKKAETVHRALVFLGLQTCTQLVTRLMLRHAFPVSNSAAMKRFWASAARGSLLAGLIARHCRAIDPELASTYALFREAGMPLLLAQFPGYEQLMVAESMHSGKALVDAEEAKFQINHARVGLQLARNWDLNADMCFAIYHHHDYGINPDAYDDAPVTSKTLVAIGLVADGLAAQVGHYSNPEWEQSKDFALDTLSLADDDIEELESAARGLSSQG